MSRGGVCWNAGLLRDHGVAGTETDRFAPRPRHFFRPSQQRAYKKQLKVDNAEHIQQQHPQHHLMPTFFTPVNVFLSSSLSSYSSSSLIYSPNILFYCCCMYRPCKEKFHVFLLLLLCNTGMSERRGKRAYVRVLTLSVWSRVYAMNLVPTVQKSGHGDCPYATNGFSWRGIITSTIIQVSAPLSRNTKWWV